MQRRYRLRTAAQFQRVRREGNNYHHRTMILFVAPSHLSFNRFGIITSKRVGKAVERNRVRRVLREALRLLNVDANTGYDIVVIGKNALVGQKFNTIVNILEVLFQQADLIERQE